jgi:acyl carrier protein
MQALGMLLRRGRANAAVSPIEWTTFVAQFTGMPVPPLLQDAFADARRRAGGDGTRVAQREVDVDFAAIDSAQRRERIAELIRRELATVLGLGEGGDTIVDDQPFTSFGLDSLTAVELRNRLQAKLGRPVSATAAFEWPSVAELAGHLDAGYAVAPSSDAEPREELAL